MTGMIQEQGIRPPEPISVLAHDGSVRPGEQIEEST